MRTGDLIHLHQVPQVACLGRLDELLAEPDRPRATALVAGYLGGEPANAHALEALLSCLCGGKGGAFLVSGCYGSGKSHLLALLGLLAAAPELWQAFAASHPGLRFSPPAGRCLVVALPLDEVGPGRPLESLVWGALQRALAGLTGESRPLAREEACLEAFQRYLLPVHEADFAAWQQERPSQPLAHQVIAYLAERDLPLELRWERTQALSRLGEACTRHGISQVVVLLDELGVHLASCPRSGREQDASFLQFLAQATHSFPLLLVGTLQRSLEDLGEMESHTLRQIRDRFRCCHLSTEHLRTVLSTRLVEHRDPASLFRLLDEAYAAWQDGGRLYFSRDELGALYPLHPLALELLQALATRSLSQTRSLMQLVCTAAAGGPETTPLLQRPFPSLLTPPDLFAAFGEELLGLPECHPQRRLYQFYLDNWSRAGFTRPLLARALLQTLLLCSAADLRWSLAELADSLLGSPAAASRPEVAEELEAMERFGGVRWERRAGEYAHLVSLETESDHGELLRRRLNDLLDSFPPGDSRVWQAALAACTAPALPLATFAPAGSALVEWCNTRRPVQVAAGPLQVSAVSLANLLAALAQPELRERGALFLALPHDPQGEQARWQASLPPPHRFSPALLCWLPRALQEREWALLCEHAGVAILLAGPMPREGRQGEQLRALLTDRQAWLSGQVAEILRAAYWEGVVRDGGGEVVADAALLAAAADFPAALSLLFGAAWQRVFPQAAACAPGIRWQGKARNRALLGGLVIPGAASDGPVTEQARAVMAPLGLLELSAGAVGLAPAGPLLQLVLDSLPPSPGPGQEVEAAHCLPFSTLYGLLATCEYGLVPEQAELLAAALVRTGRLLALDDFLRPVGLQSDQPLADYVRFVAAPPTADPAVLEAATRLAAAAFGREVKGGQSYQLWDVLCQWRQAVLRREGMDQELDAAIGALGGDPLPWADWHATLAAALHFARALDPQAPACRGLRAAVQAAGEDLPAAAVMLERYRLLRAFLDRHAARAAALVALLHHQGLHFPRGSVLLGARRRLLGLLSDPAALVAGGERWTAAADSFLACYAREYAAWHTQAYGAARYRPLLALRESPEWCALRALEPLPVTVADCFSRLQAALAEALATHCPGAPLDLPEGGPACPRCGLAMGTLPSLPAPEELLAPAGRGIAGYLAALAAPDRRERLQRALTVAPPPPPLRRRVTAALALGEQSPAHQVARAFTPEVVAYLAGALHRRPCARRRSAELVASLAGREMTKGDAWRLFADWLDPDQSLAEGDYLAID